MKLVVSLLALCCLVSVSHQGNLSRSPQRGRAHFAPLFYANGIPAGYDIIDDDKPAEQVMQRNNNGANDKPFISRLFNNNILTPVSKLVTLTSTTTNVVTSTITTASLVKCIPLDQFSSTAPKNCARRRRDVAELLDAALPDEIVPSLPQPLETSAVVAVATKEIQTPQLDLVSSKSDILVDQPQIGVDELLPRLAFTTVKYVTVINTATAFVPTAVTATKTLASKAGLVCLPSGYSVCA